RKEVLKCALIKLDQCGSSGGIGWPVQAKLLTSIRLLLGSAHNSAENNYDDHGSGFDEVEEHFGRVERPLDEGVGEHHFSTHFAEDSRSQIHDVPIAVHQFREQVARKYNERDAKGESKNDQPVIAAGGS